jgi:hypothetical protein
MILEKLGRGDTTINRENAFKDWAKETCRVLGLCVNDETIVWQTKEPQESMIS